MHECLFLSVVDRGIRLRIPRGYNLLDALLENGIDLPILCNRNGSCGKCRVVVKADTNPVTDVETMVLGRRLLNDGFRLACRTKLYGSGEVILTSITEEDPMESSFSGEEVFYMKNKGTSCSKQIRLNGLSLAIDIGTTTLSGYLFDEKAELLSHAIYFNPTTIYGGDVITRMTYVQRNKGNFKRLRESLIRGIEKLIHILCSRADITGDIQDISNVGVCGNTIMQHLFIGLDPVNIGFYPYKPMVEGLFCARSSDIPGLEYTGLSKDTIIIVSPVIGGFVGGDIVCGILATGLHSEKEPSLLIDLGTNGEMVLCSNDKLLVGSASAGPAFEGYRVRNGMRATIGAIDSIVIEPDIYDIRYSVIGDVQPRGICGTGVISAISELLKIDALNEMGHIDPARETERIQRGMFTIATEGESVTGTAITITDRDVEVVQQAKAAFCTAIHYLLQIAKINPDDLKKIYLAGAFGSKVNASDIINIGLIPQGINAMVKTVGNAAGMGIAKLILCKDSIDVIMNFMEKVQTVEFSSFSDFEERFINSLFFKKNGTRNKN